MKWTKESVVADIARRMGLSADPKAWTSKQIKFAVGRFSYHLNEARKRDLPVLAGGSAVTEQLEALAAANVEFSSYHLIAAIEAYFEAYEAAQDRLNRTAALFARELERSSA